MLSLGVLRPLRALEPDFAVSDAQLQAPVAVVLGVFLEELEELPVRDEGEAALVRLLVALGLPVLDVGGGAGHLVEAHEFLHHVVGRLVLGAAGAHDDDDPRHHLGLDDDLEPVVQGALEHEGREAVQNGGRDPKLDMARPSGHGDTSSLDLLVEEVLAQKVGDDLVELRVDGAAVFGADNVGLILGDRARQGRVATGARGRVLLGEVLIALAGLVQEDVVHLHLLL